VVQREWADDTLKGVATKAATGTRCASKLKPVATEDKVKGSGLKTRRYIRRAGLFFVGAGVGGVAGFGMFGGPVFGREGHAPEGGARSGEFEAYFGFAVAHGAEEHYMALFFFLGALMVHVEFAAAGDARGQQNERTVGVNGQGFRFFFEDLSCRVGPANADSYLHQHALAASTCSGGGGSV